MQSWRWNATHNFFEAYYKIYRFIFKAQICIRAIALKAIFQLPYYCCVLSFKEERPSLPSCRRDDMITVEVLAAMFWLLLLRLIVLVFFFFITLTQLWNQLRLELKNQSQRQVMIHSCLYSHIVFPLHRSLKVHLQIILIN